MTDATETPVGWTFPTAEARKCHWFDADDGTRDTAVSLCGRYMMLRRDPRAFSPDSGKSRDDCAACRKKLDAR